MTQVERAGSTLTVNSKILMHHTVLRVNHDREPVGVAITTNPLEFDATKYFAQVVMHKTRSHNCAVQVARYVRRRFEIEEPVVTVRTARALEARIGSACTTSAQYEPNERTPGWGVFQHIAATSIANLLREVADGHNASRTRYVVYEVRGTTHDGIAVRFRGTTNKFNALENRFMRCPPDTLKSAEVVQVGRFESNDEAQRAIRVFPLFYSNQAWTRRPSLEYMRKVLRVDVNGDLVWAVDGVSAIHQYDVPSVVVGPHVYTERMARHFLETGEWVDGRTVEGLKLKYGA